MEVEQTNEILRGHLHTKQQLHKATSTETLVWSCQRQSPPIFSEPTTTLATSNQHPAVKNKDCRCDQDNSDCMCGPSGFNNIFSLHASAELSDLSQTHHTSRRDTEIIPSQDTLSEHFSCVRGRLFDAAPPALGRLSTDAYVAAGSN